MRTRVGIGRFASAALVCASALACNDPGAPAPAVTVSITPVPVVATIDPSASATTVHLALTATIRNDGPGSVYLAHWCDPPIEQRTTTGWAPAATGTVCSLVLYPPTEIPEGTTLTRDLSIAASLTGSSVSGSSVPGMTKWLSATPDGTYRVALPLAGPSGQILPEHSRVSADFTIVH